MRIAKATLARNWTWSVLAALIVFAVLGFLDLRLKAQTGVGTFDLGGLADARQYRLAFAHWSSQFQAAWAGFDLGFGFLLIPLYAAAFFYSGILAAENFAPRPGPVRHGILLAALVPPVGALFDIAAHGLQAAMLLEGPRDNLARLAYTAAGIRSVAVTVGVLLLAGALGTRFGKMGKRAA